MLLKNEGVPAAEAQRAYPGRGWAADSINQQAGGWSITWQGIDVPQLAFPNAQSIWKGIEGDGEGGRRHVAMRPTARSRKARCGYRRDRGKALYMRIQGRVAI